MHVVMPHTLGREAAIARVKEALEKAKPELAGKAVIEEERWEAGVLHFAFTAQGQRIAGALAVGEKEFTLDAKLPLMLRLFEGRIEKEIQRQAAALAARQ